MDRFFKSMIKRESRDHLRGQCREGKVLRLFLNGLTVEQLAVKWGLERKYVMKILRKSVKIIYKYYRELDGIGLFETIREMEGLDRYPSLVYVQENADIFKKLLSGEVHYLTDIFFEYRVEYTRGDDKVGYRLAGILSSAGRYGWELVDCFKGEDYVLLKRRRQRVDQV